MNTSIKRQIVLREIHRLQYWEYLSQAQRADFVVEAANALPDQNKLKAVLRKFGLKEKEPNELRLAAISRRSKPQET